MDRHLPDFVNQLRSESPHSLSQAGCAYSWEALASSSYKCLDAMRVPAQVHVIDAQGLTRAPNLQDAHCHPLFDPVHSRCPHGYQGLLRVGVK